MGCSSSVPVQPQPTHNGHVVKSSPPGTPPAQQRQQQPQQQPQQQERNRKDSASSKSSSSSSSKSSVRSKSNNNEKNGRSSAHSQAAEGEEERPASPGRPVTAPGGEADNTDQKPTESEVKPEADEDVGSEKPNFDEGALKEYVELENKIREAESKDLENGYKTKHGRLVELYKSIGESKKQVEILRQQT